MNAMQSNKSNNFKLLRKSLGHVESLADLPDGNSSTLVNGMIL